MLEHAFKPSSKVACKLPQVPITPKYQGHHDLSVARTRQT